MWLALNSRISAACIFATCLMNDRWKSIISIAGHTNSDESVNQSQLIESCMQSNRWLLASLACNIAKVVIWTRKHTLETEQQFTKQEHGWKIVMLNLVTGVEHLISKAVTSLMWEIIWTSWHQIEPIAFSRPVPSKWCLNSDAPKLFYIHWITVPNFTHMRTSESSRAEVHLNVT